MGTEGAVLEAFGAAWDGPPPTAVECIVLPAQTRPDGCDEHIWTEVPEAADDTAVTKVVYDRVTEVRGSGAEICVASFRPSVKNVAEVLGAVHQGGVVFVHLATYAPPATASEPLEWDDSWMKRDKAVETLVHVIGHSSARVRMTDLRKLLAAYDSRFRKQVGTFTARPKFMSMLVSLAVERKLVAIAPTVPGDNNPQVELTPAGRARVVPLAAVPSPPAQPSGPAALEAAAAAAKEPRSLSDRCIDVLRQNDMGPFQELREDVYAQIERLVGEATRSPDRLIRDAVHAVRDERGDAPSKSGKKFPWTRLRAFITRLERLVPVFLSEGRPVTVSLSTTGALVDALADDWRRRLDGELICFVLRNDVVVTQYDYDELAGALYNSRQSIYYDKVQEVVDYLASTGRITEAPGDEMRIVLAPPETGEFPHSVGA
ncbi:hypothetical protein [Actinomadura violacea]|uniref:Uncharacterized protein n=1 Tax=Actinomadura violacea TaxID=2819934 RepID=A0ABS3S078_9ACTN|nr:hypothetical protein [Actinomadura violacea]MBO2462410.1 hypothetical protein [Actinomadura violacea]